MIYIINDKSLLYIKYNYKYKYYIVFVSKFRRKEIEEILGLSK